MNKKTKILMLSDHPLSMSGVGTQSRWLIDGLVKTGKYSFRCLGAAIKHNDYSNIAISNDFVIKPTDGFGSQELIRQILVSEKPDAILLFTDPRQFMHIWAMEDEIHQVCPILYNHLWDNNPTPEFNKVLYDSTDLINCINYSTYQACNEWFPERTNYIPHALPDGLYRPLSDQDKMDYKRNILGPERADHFIALYVGRNARRKMVNDIIISFRDFLNNLQNKYNHKKATLVMHTDPGDSEGSNLFSVIEKMGVKDNIVFSKDRIDFDKMNIVYNIADVQLNRSCAEGFGLPILEGKMTGLPAIAIKTGGLTRQIEDHITGQQYGVALDPEIQNCVGNQQVPYIFEDYVSNKTYSDAIMKMYEMPKADKEKLKIDCQNHCKRDYRLDNLISNWDDSIQQTLKNWNYKSWDCTEF